MRYLLTTASSVVGALILFMDEIASSVWAAFNRACSFRYWRRAIMVSAL